MNENFCIIPFIVLNCRPNGTLKTCSQAEGAEPIPGFNLNQDKLESFWNSDWMMDFRRRKIAGERISQCEGCKRVEKTGNKSKRQIYLERFYDKYKNRINPNGYVNEMPAWWEFRLSSVCNSACLICTPQNSTLIEKEHRKRYHQLSKYDREQVDGCTKNQLGNGRFLRDFWKHVDSIDAIELHGGEPLIDDNVIDTLEKLVNLGHSKRMHLHVHSNINKIDDHIIDLLNEFQSGWFGVSIDAYGEENDFLRWPSKWDIVDSNFRRIHLHSGWSKTITSSVTVYQCLTLWKLLDWYLEFQNEWDIYFYHVHSPDRFAVEMIDIEKRREAANEIESYKPIFLSHTGLDLLINILRSERVPDISEYRNFITYNDFKDNIRSQDSRSLFPHIGEIYDKMYDAI